MVGKIRTCFNDHWPLIVIAVLVLMFVYFLHIQSNMNDKYIVPQMVSEIDGVKLYRVYDKQTRELIYFSSRGTSREVLEGRLTTTQTVVNEDSSVE